MTPLRCSPSFGRCGSRPSLLDGRESVASEARAGCRSARLYHQVRGEGSRARGARRAGRLDADQPPRREGLDMRIKGATVRASERFWAGDCQSFRTVWLSHYVTVRASRRLGIMMRSTLESLHGQFVVATCEEGLRSRLSASQCVEVDLPTSRSTSALTSRCGQCASTENVWPKMFASPCSVVLLKNMIRPRGGDWRLRTQDFGNFRRAGAPSILLAERF